jgi:putative FmdB family regulatory protein
MPTYEYRCTKCEKVFSVVMSMAEHDQTNVRCPACGSGEVVQQYSTFYAKTSKKS